MQENNSIIIAMLEELLTISKSQQAGQRVNTNVDLTPIKELIESSNKHREQAENDLQKLVAIMSGDVEMIHRRVKDVRAVIGNSQNWCGAGKMLSIDAAGNFYPCTRFAQYSLRSKNAWIIGNINDGIDSNKLRPFLTLDRCTQSSQECIDCEVASGCAWCQGENYDAAETPTIYQRATAICKMHKARVRANNYYWNKLYRKLELEGEREDYEKNKIKSNNKTC